jgi:fatty-acyl-CoA synthase
MTLIERLLATPASLSFLLDVDPRRVERVVSADELRSLTWSAARQLRSRGVGTGDRVILALPTGSDLVACLLATLWLGAVPVPLSPVPRGRGRALALERAQGVLADCHPRLVVADQPTLEAMSPGALWSWLPTLVAEAEAPSPGASAPMTLIQYTSGSTGTPKGVLVTPANLIANLEAIGAAVHVGDADRVLSWLPLYHDMGLVGSLLFSIYFGVPLFLYSPFGFLARPLGWLQAISTHRATLCPAPHLAYALCARPLSAAQLEGVDLSSVRSMLDGSEPIQASTARAFCSRFAAFGLRADAYLPVYGLAEATLAVAMPERTEVLRVDRVRREALQNQRRAERAADTEADVAEVVSVGRVLDGITVEIRDESTGLPCAERGVGEICLRGASISPGYFGAPFAEAALHTGDLGYLVDGRLYVVERLKDLIIRGGVNYYPSDIERLVGEVDGARRGRVVVFGDVEEGGASEGIVVVAEARSLEGSESVREGIVAAFSAALGFAPSQVVLVEAGVIPTTPTGKLMRRRCRELYRTGALARGATACATTRP